MVASAKSPGTRLCQAYARSPHFHRYSTLTPRCVLPCEKRHFSARKIGRVSVNASTSSSPVSANCGNSRAGTNEPTSISGWRGAGARTHDRYPGHATRGWLRAARPPAPSSARSARSRGGGGMLAYRYLAWIHMLTSFFSISLCNRGRGQAAPAYLPGCCLIHTGITVSQDDHLCDGGGLRRGFDKLPRRHRCAVAAAHVP